MNNNSNHIVGLNSKEKKPSMSGPQALLTGIYEEWTPWGECKKSCQQSRERKCRNQTLCSNSSLQEKRSCKSRENCSKRANKQYLKLVEMKKSDNLVVEILYKLLYGTWMPWEKCSMNSCKEKRRRVCIQPAMCGSSYIQEERYCRRSGQTCKKHYVLRTSTPLHRTNDNDNAKKIQATATSKIGNSTLKSGQESNSSVFLQISQSCGRRPAYGAGSYRIVGGQQSRKHSWPWQVAILETWMDQFCGGTLIAPQWVLTAAHCLTKKNGKKKNVIVRIGDHNIKAEDVGEEIFKQNKQFLHPDYEFKTIINDIALLKLENPVTPSKTIGFACLPKETDKFPEKKRCYIIGWGKEKNTSLYGSPLLLEAQVPLVKNTICQNVFDYVIHETQICAGSSQGGIDSCAGDSGGPLLCPVTESGKTRWLVYGVTSYGEGCGEKGKFGIYTNVRKYINWIKNITDSN